MHLFEQLMAGVTLYAIFSIFGVIGCAMWALGGVRNLTPTHLLTGKLLGLGLFATLLWWGSIAGVLDYTSTPAIAGVWLIILMLAGWWLWQQTQRSRIQWPDGRKVLRQEWVALALLLCYLLFRSASAQLESTEKFMDLALLTGAVRAVSFPFVDFWLADQTVNYYYFGYLPFALLLRLTGIAEPLGYHLVMGLLFVLGLQLSYGLARTVTGAHRVGLLAAVLAMLAGNLHFVSCMTAAVSSGRALLLHCPYPKATRILNPSYTINEMPAYTFFLGDLHPHVISIPFFLSALFLIWQLISSKHWNWRLATLVIFSLALAAVVHAWDFMTLGALLGLLVLTGGMVAAGGTGDVWRIGLIGRMVFLGLAAISPFLLYWPFFTDFDSPVAGIGFAPSFVAMAELQGQAQYPSGAGFLLLMWGGLLVPLLAAAVVLIRRRVELTHSLRYAAALALMGLLLIAFTELFYFRDLFHVTSPLYFRANTVFKFGFHAWMLLALAAAVLVRAAWVAMPSRALVALCTLCFAGSLLYPLEAFRQLAKFGPGGAPAFAQRNLDGARFISQHSAADGEVIEWLRAQGRGRPVLIEAFGESYTHAGRIGVFSGAVNVANWPSHQWTWRFAYPEGVHAWLEARQQWLDTGHAIANRIGERIRGIYEAENKACAQLAVRELGADYLYVGELERTTYPNLDDTLLRELGEVVFEAFGSYLVRLDDAASIGEAPCP